VALACATTSGARIVLMPGQKVDVLGTQQARFDFDGCMAASSRVVESRR
jgi:hypothetical protein